MSDETRPRLPVDRFDYHLPSELIAQHPMEPRDASRLLVVPKGSCSFEDRIFHELPDILNPGDVLVLNDTRVIPARLFARRATGGTVEFLLLRHIDGDVWSALARPARRLRSGETLSLLDLQGLETDAPIQVLERTSNSEMSIAIADADSMIHRYGQMPLPPYIAERLDDQERYQTVYANHEGSAAAPTAGLHFTPDVLDRCQAFEIDVHYVTLHVGLDTFQPIRVENALEHQIHSEWYQVSSATVAALRRATSEGRRVIAVGTTSARTLETIAPTLDSSGNLAGETNIYITPGYEFKLVDGLITNFHLPRTTLLLMVSALAGAETIRAAYGHAISERYRFYSFGDAMFIV